MVEWIGIGVAVVAGIGAVAYRSSKWPDVRSYTAVSLLAVLMVSGFTGVGLFIAWLFPSQIEQILLVFAAVAGGSLVAILIIEFANWVREP